VPLHPPSFTKRLPRFHFLILYWRISKPHKPAHHGLYLVLYSAVRFFDAFLRDPQLTNSVRRTVQQCAWISLG